jgi:hypothetical protein
MGRHRKQKKHHSQKIYKMRGCNKTCRNHFGGDNNLAYPSSNIPKIPNPFLSYNGKGGKSCGISPEPSNLAYSNINANNPLYPSTGLKPGGFDFINSLPKKGGSTCNTCNLFNGGNVGQHRHGCKCSSCKGTGSNMNGGNGMSSQSNNGIPYPNGTVGTPWTATSWPASKGMLPGDANHFPLNTYKNDVQLQMINTGANPPFSVGGSRARRGRGKGKGRKTRGRKQKAGALSNFIGQDFINLGRQLQYGVGSAYNGLSGVHQPVNPMPWKGQLPTTTNISALQKSMM